MTGRTQQKPRSQPSRAAVCGCSRISPSFRLAHRYANSCRAAPSSTNMARTYALGGVVWGHGAAEIISYVIG